MSDLIERQAAIDVLAAMQGRCTSKAALIQNSKIWQQIKDLPSAQTEIIRCKDCRKHNVSSGYKNDCCPLYEWRGMSYGHEHDYQYCCFAEGRTDERLRHLPSRHLGL